MADAGAKRHWTFAALGGVALLALALGVFRAPPDVERVVVPAKQGVVIDRSPALRSEADFFDPTPLFLPTIHNAAQRAATPKQREATATFRDYPAKLGFGMNDLKVDALALPKPVPMPVGPAGDARVVLETDRVGPLAAGMGQTAEDVQPLPKRAGYLAVTSSATGRRVLAQEIDALALPVGTGGWWHPVEYLAAVDAAGLVGPLVPTVRSGVDEIDLQLPKYLARTLRIGERLPPGYYRICVGP